MRAPQLAAVCTAATIALVSLLATRAPTRAQDAPTARGLCRVDPAAAMRGALAHLPYGVVLGRTRITAFVRAQGGTSEELGAGRSRWFDVTGNVEVSFRQGVADSITLTGRGPADWDATLGECLHGQSDWRTNLAEAARIFGAVGTEVRRPRQDICYASGAAVGYGFNFASRVGDVVVDLTQQDEAGCGPAYFAWSVATTSAP